MRRCWWAAVAVAALLGSAGCDGDGGEVGQVSSGVTGGTDERVVTGNVAGLRQARLDVLSGASIVVVRAADLGDLLYRAITPEGSTAVPQVSTDGDVVRVSLRGGDGGGMAELEVELNSTVSWEIHLDGGASSESVDMGAGRLTSLDFGAGVSTIDLVLPRPTGTVPVRMSGGTSTMDVRLPAGVAAQVVFAGGAGTATIDGTAHTGIAGGTTLATPDWETASERYRLEMVAGLSSLTLERAPA